MTTHEDIAIALAVDDIGIYPKSRIDESGKKHERTEWQNGWNKCLLSISLKAARIEDELGKLPERIIDLIRQDTLRVSIRDDKLKLWVLCNDLFWWGAADGEDFELSNLPDLEKALEDAPEHGDILWCCRKRGMRPQKPYYKYFTATEAALFDACGPERDE